MARSALPFTPKAGALVKALGPSYRRSITHKYEDADPLLSPAYRRQSDVDMLVERLPATLLRHIRLMSDDEIALLDIVAAGVPFAGGAR